MNDDLITYRLDREAALVILDYYAALARECEWGHEEVIRMSPDKVDTVAEYCAATISTELRFLPNGAHNNYCRNGGRNGDRSYAIEVLCEDSGHNFCCCNLDTAINGISYKGRDEQKYLRSAYCLFSEVEWPEGFGGPAWAHCTWRTLELISALRHRNGYADRLLWETCLNSCHNNSRWLNKLGTCCVYQVLCLGAEATPAHILDVYYSGEPLAIIREVPFVTLEGLRDYELPATDDVWGRIYE